MSSPNIKEDDRSKLQIYMVEVQQQGKPIAFYEVEASNALAAINWVESRYNAPVVLEESIIEDEEGLEHRITLARNWHGYMFQARAIRSPFKAAPDWQPETADLLQAHEVSLPMSLAT